jgi:DNA-binding beta-propeller fold protein YncE
MRFATAILLAIALAVVLVSQPAPHERVGPLPDGGFLLNSGWILHPAGKQVPLSTLPMSLALSPDGKYLLALNGGYMPPSVSVLDTVRQEEISRVPIADGWLGLTFSPDGKLVYVGGGSRAAVFEFSFEAGRLTPARTFAVVAESERTSRDFIGDVAVSPNGRLLYAADLYRDSVVVINPQSGRVVDRFKTARRPYRILFHPDGQSFFVSSWADGTVLNHKTDTGEVLEAVRIGPHPTDMVWRDGPLPGEDASSATWKARLYVAAANTNSVGVVGVSETQHLQVIGNINVSFAPRQPAGMTPSGLALNADRSQLFVVCSNANAVAVVDVTEERAKVAGFLPTGWYPTAARALADGRLVVLNGRGVRSYANPRGPDPTRKAVPAHLGESGVEYVGRMQTGTASFIEPFNADQLAAHTRTVMANTPYRDIYMYDARVPAGNPIPSSPSASSPIQHVIYIVKENRTYDQVFGDLKEGNGDPSLTLFGENAGPNHRKLAREFVLLDNFYVNSDVSADGHNWTTAAIAPDYVEKLWPSSYAKRRKLSDYQGQEPAAKPPAGYLWTNAIAAGVSLRNYGYFVTNRAKPGPDGVQVEKVNDPVLRPVTNLRYRSFDLNYSDLDRAKVFLQDLAEFEKSGSMPRLILMRLGNDHTSGTSPGKIAPLASFADNDYALGLIVEAVSKSRFWPKTAIFVLEDDAQNGADHVDSHRSPAFVLSPYVKRHAVDSTMYNTTSMLRTMELILGLRPMTHFDASSRPMHAAFQAAPDLHPYQAEKPRISLEERNPASSPTAATSARMDFSDADRIDDHLLNRVLWLAIRGREEPAPVSSFFSK